jgi:hypothetical protein
MEEGGLRKHRPVPASIRNNEPTTRNQSIEDALGPRAGIHLLCFSLCMSLSRRALLVI